MNQAFKFFQTRIVVKNNIAQRPFVNFFVFDDLGKMFSDNPDKILFEIKPANPAVYVVNAVTQASDHGSQRRFPAAYGTGNSHKFHKKILRFKTLTNLCTKPRPAVHK